MIVLDTNVLSELLRSNPDPAVLRWVGTQAATQLWTTAITRAEMLYGVCLLPSGQRRQQLQTAVTALFDEDFTGRVLPFDNMAADCFASIAANRKRVGRPISQFDAQIAAITLANDGQLATRNSRDFEHCGLQLIDPWQVPA